MSNESPDQLGDSCDQLKEKRDQHMHSSQLMVESPETAGFVAEEEEEDKLREELSDEEDNSVYPDTSIQLQYVSGDK